MLTYSVSVLNFLKILCSKLVVLILLINYQKSELKLLNVGRLRFELRTSRLKAGCSTAELATHFVKLSTYEIIPFKGKKNNFLSQVEQ